MTIQQMKKFKEIEELRYWYWEKLCFDLYEEAEKEINPTFWQRISGTKEEEIKELQDKKFEKLFKKMMDAK